MDCKDGYHTIRVVKDRGDVYYTIYMKCGERNLNAIVDLAWIKNFEAKAEYAKIPLVRVSYYRDVAAAS